MKWRVLLMGKEEPYMNMAIDEAVYEAVCQEKSLPTIRFYDWQPASFSYGYNQLLEKELDVEKVRQSSYSYVRRPTGGRLVLHEDEVTYAVVSPIAGEMSGKLTNAYLRIAEALQAGFRLMGIDLEMSQELLSREHQKEAKNPCFSSSSQYELTYKRKKIVGSAQVRNNKAFLQHGSILRRYNQEKVADYLPNLKEEERLRMKTFLSKRTTAINSILGEDVSFSTVVDYLYEGFKKQWNGDSFYTEQNLTEHEKKRSISLFDSKYADKRWNETPAFSKKVLTYNQ